jgi:hypothetical protein
MNDSAPAILNKNIGKITSDILSYFMKSNAFLCEPENLQVYLEIEFERIARRIVKKMIPTFQIPTEYDDKFDIVKCFTYKCFIGREPYMNAKREAFRNLKTYKCKERVNEIFIEDDTELGKVSYRQYVEGQGMEEKIEKAYLLVQLQNANNDFFKYLNSVEAQVFRAVMLGDMSYEELSKVIGKFQNGKEADKMTLSRLRNVLEFRLCCQYALCKVFDEEKMIKGLNRFPKLCKRFFHKEKLTSIPDKDDLIIVAHGDYEKFPKIMKKEGRALSDIELQSRMSRYDLKAKSSNSSEYRWKSKVSFDKRVHKTYKVYVWDNGYAYDHSLGQSGYINEFGFVENIKNHGVSVKLKEVM